MAPADPLDARLRRVRLLLLDVDGVLTDGTVTIDAAGGEAKRFSIRDGAAMKWLQRDGIAIALLSGRPSGATTRRAAELGIATVWQDGHDKIRGYDEIVGALGLEDAEVAYMGDDLLDLPVFARVGVAAAPADAVPAVLERAHFVSRHDGGHGAVRELIERLLAARDRWDAIVREFAGE